MSTLVTPRKLSCQEHSQYLLLSGNSYCVSVEEFFADLNVDELAMPCHALAKRVPTQLNLELIQIKLIGEYV